MQIKRQWQAGNKQQVFEIMKLRRYWFIMFIATPFGPRNIGVTAFSKSRQER